MAGVPIQRQPARLGDGVSALSTTPHIDERGRLVSFDPDALPFVVRRVFVVTAVPAGSERGGHRHRRGAQALFCLTGRVDVEVRRRDVRQEVVLTPDAGGIVIHAGTWARQRYVLEASALMVLASEPYDSDNYDPDDDEVTT